MQDQQQVKRPKADRVRAEIGHWVREHHVHEVLDIAERVVRVDERMADCILVALRRQRRHLGDDALGRQIPVSRVVEIHGFVIVRGQGAHDADHDGHRMGVVSITRIHVVQVLMDIAAELDGGLELLHLGLGRQFAVEQQVADFEVVAVLGQLLDGVATMHQNALLTVQIGNGAATARGGHEARVNSKHAQTAVESFRINHGGAVGAFMDGTLDGFSCRVIRYGYGLFCHYLSPKIFRKGNPL